MSEIYAGSKDAKHASERLIEALEHCENAWKSVAEKQLILHHLFAEVSSILVVFFKVKLSCLDYGYHFEMRSAFCTVANDCFGQVHKLL